MAKTVKSEKRDQAKALLRHAFAGSGAVSSEVASRIVDYVIAAVHEEINFAYPDGGTKVAFDKAVDERRRELDDKPYTDKFAAKAVLFLRRCAREGRIVSFEDLEAEIAGLSKAFGAVEVEGDAAVISPGDRLRGWANDAGIGRGGEWDAEMIAQEMEDSAHELIGLLSELCKSGDD